MSILFIQKAISFYMQCEHCKERFGSYIDEDDINMGYAIIQCPYCQLMNDLDKETIGWLRYESYGE
ncbi:MAG: hypothetical protein ACOCZ5_02875 [bacterium]